MRVWSTLTAVGIVSVLAGCGPASSPAPPDDGATTSAPDRGDELVGRGIVLQDSPEGAPELCVGAVAASLPPQCAGPALAGAFSWDDVEAQESGGVRWTEDTYDAVGRFAPTAGDEGTFTLTRPLTTTAPDGAVATEVPDEAFPQLCTDPFRGGDPDAGELDPQPLLTALEGLDGYVTSWVSDGSSMFNVVVTGDAEAAHERLREVWPGALCVEQRDLPPEADVRAAQEILALPEHRDLHVLSSGAGGVTGMLEVELLVADGATVDRIHRLVAPWLTPDQVRVSAALRPLGD